MDMCEPIPAQDVILVCRNKRPDVISGAKTEIKLLFSEIFSKIVMMTIEKMRTCVIWIKKQGWRGRKYNDVLDS